MKNIIFDKTAKPNEMFIATILKKYIFTRKKVTVGDMSKKIPDIQISDDKIGIEVVQVELDKDLDNKYIWEYYNKCNGDPLKMQYFVNKNYPQHNYKFFVINGKVAFWTTFELGHSVDYLRDKYQKELFNKLNKLNNGNYADFKGDVFLAVSNYQRNRDYLDFSIFVEEYEKLILTFKQYFKKVYLITSNSIFIYDTNQNKQIEEIKFDFNLCVKEYKKLRNY